MMISCRGHDTCTFLVKIKWTPDMISDLINGVNKFGTDWKRIKKEYDFTVSIAALQSRWYNTIRHQCQLEDGKWKMAQQGRGRYRLSPPYTVQHVACNKL